MAKSLSVLKQPNLFDVVRKNRITLFKKEVLRQKSLITKFEKIKVRINGPPQECNLVMNKHISTPFDCAKHIHEYVSKRAALALVNGVPWDMHLPLQGDSEIHFLHFKNEDPRYLNKCFWRTGAFILGRTIETSFNDNNIPTLYSWAPIDVNRCHFSYDFHLPSKNGIWESTKAEYRILEKEANVFCWQEHDIIPLKVGIDKALEIFQDSKIKQEQAKQMAEQASSENDNPFTVKIYKCGDHIDLSRGPMIANTRLFGRFNICQIHSLKEKGCGTNVYRAQAIACPSQLSIHRWTWSLIEHKASKPNYDYLPILTNDLTQDLKENADESLNEKSFDLQKFHNSLPDPECPIPSNKTWKELHLNTDNESNTNETLHKNSVKTEKATLKKDMDMSTNNSNNNYKNQPHPIELHQGNRVYDNRLKFNRLRWQWEHRPVIRQEDRASFYVNTVRHVPQKFVKIPKNVNQKQ